MDKIDQNIEQKCNEIIFSSHDIDISTNFFVISMEGGNQSQVSAKQKQRLEVLNECNFNRRLYLICYIEYDYLAESI